MKKLTMIFLAITLCLSGLMSVSAMSYSNDTPVFNSLSEREAAGDDSDVFIIKEIPQNEEVQPFYQGGYIEYRYARTENDNNKRLGYHPDFPNWKYVKEYWFSTSKTVSMGFNIGYGYFSAGVAATTSSSSGYTIGADQNYKSRPWVRADVETKFYDMYIYDDSGNLLEISEEYYKTATISDVQYFVDHLDY